MLGDLIDLNQHSFILIVGEDVQSLKRIREKLAGDSDYTLFDVGSTLSAELLHIPARHRSFRTSRWLADKIRFADGDVLVLENNDLLFEPSLGLDPLALFVRYSRTKRIIVLWPGIYDGNILSYAVPEHEHYRKWKNPQGVVYRSEQFRHLI